MLVRKNKRSDIPAIARLYYQTVHCVNSKDYSEEQINAWAPRVYEDAYWQRRFRNYKVFVAEEHGVICGFAEFDTKTGHIDCFYVHHKWQRKGIGTRLMQQILSEARKRNLPRLFADVCITALPFFMNMGFAVIRRQKKIYRNRTFRQFRMAKRL